MVKSILGIFRFRIWKKIHFIAKPGINYLFINIESNHLLDRYLLNFLQQLNTRNRTIIVLPFKLKFFRRFFEGRNWRPYQTMLVESNEVYFTFTNFKTDWKEVSFEYFDSNPEISDSIRIQIGPHPIHFENFREISVNQFRTGIFFAGAQTEDYHRCFSKEIWKMPNRMESIKFLQENGQGQIISSRINHDQYCEPLKSHRYFLALPGMHMPLCHNVFEAIFCGCIPVIHSLYLKLLPKELQEPLMPYSWETHDELLEMGNVGFHSRHQNHAMACPHLQSFGTH